MSFVGCNSKKTACSFLHKLPLGLTLDSQQPLTPRTNAFLAYKNLVATQQGGFVSVQPMPGYSLSIGGAQFTAEVQAFTQNKDAFIAVHNLHVNHP